MSQHNHTVAMSSTMRQSRHGFLLIGIGIVWLLLAAALLAYQIWYPANVEITWQTATEQRTAGYNIYRNSDSDAGYVLVNEDQLIDSEGDAVSGANYSFIDNNVKAGETYYYILEEVEFDGTQIQYRDEIFEYTVPLITWWAVALATGSILIGAALLYSGLKERNKR